MIEISNLSEDEYTKLTAFTEKLLAATNLISDTDNMLSRASQILATAKERNGSSVIVSVFDLRTPVDQECIEDIRDAFKALRQRHVEELDSMKLSTGQEP